MGPVLIFTHVDCEGPGYLSDFLAAADVPFRLICIDRGEPVPESPGDAAGLVFMGGPMSVNDSLPWIRQELDLIRRAADRVLPMLGHCLGAQLLAKALGGSVGPNPVREIGWWPVERVDRGPGGRWASGLPDRFEVFHWHGETFTLPVGAEHLLRSTHCENQAFALGNVLGLQFHVEVTAPMVEEWAVRYAADLEAPSPAVQDHAALRHSADERAAATRPVADALYGQWLRGLRR